MWCLWEHYGMENIHYITTQKDVMITSTKVWVLPLGCCWHVAPRDQIDVLCLYLISNLLDIMLMFHQWSIKRLVVFIIRDKIINEVKIWSILLVFCLFCHFVLQKGGLPSPQLSILHLNYAYVTTYIHLHSRLSRMKEIWIIKPHNNFCLLFSFPHSSSSPISPHHNSSPCYTTYSPNILPMHHMRSK